MTQQQAHGSVRPGGRTARTRAAVLDAALGELGAGQYAELTVEGLAARSGVHASTIRRRWGSVHGVVLDLFDHVAGEIRIPDTGNLREDLRLLAEGIWTLYTSAQHRNTLFRMVAAATAHPEGERTVRDFFAARTRQVSGMVRHAAARGEIPQDTDVLAVIEAVSAPIYYRLLVSRQPLDSGVARRTADAAYHAARAGVFAFA
ncbi:TetR-like C-terminal domain-containing protein [Streptomyces sp. PU-14G]|uniref:TetR-like C-terminal domain-containing protein n=1 Tax=Streptomyces sp. PU-14G TaxID=2800808 RepID=UPI0034DF115D